MNKIRAGAGYPARGDVRDGERGTVRGHWSQVGTCDARAATYQYGGTCGPGCGTIKNCTV
jgi:hypothetical protein